MLVIYSLKGGKDVFVQGWFTCCYWTAMCVYNVKINSQGPEDVLEISHWGRGPPPSQRRVAADGDAGRSSREAQMSRS